ncbi:class I SAM-dependent methyltransferase [Microbulbifer sp. JMSA003]|uniref:class I SAM-dependent methyltransferase n=1 Tax=Microbulbifer sp. JMSA003 TaxID=3243369 RepID=UPI00403925DF
MFIADSDKEWEKFGKEDAYYGVLTEEKFRKENLTDSAKQDFFKTGQSHVHNILTKVKQHVDDGFVVKRALDFGCGVGRVAIPLAYITEDVTGVDISDSMLMEAKKNSHEQGLKNIEFVKADEKLSLVQRKFNFIHSFIVFQHIPVKKGQRLFSLLLDKLESGGVCVAHFSYAKTSKLKRLTSFLSSTVPFSGNILNLLKGEPFMAPRMQMNNYDLNKLLSQIQREAMSHCYLDFTDHGGALGVTFYFKKL